MVITESLLMLGPVSGAVVTVVDEVELEVVEVVELVVADTVVAVGEEVCVVVPASVPPQAAATSARANKRKIARLIAGEDKSGWASDDGFRGKPPPGAHKPCAGSR